MKLTYGKCNIVPQVPFVGQSDLVPGDVNYPDTPWNFLEYSILAIDDWFEASASELRESTQAFPLDVSLLHSVPYFIQVIAID